MLANQAPTTHGISADNELETLHDVTRIIGANRRFWIAADADWTDTLPPMAARALFRSRYQHVARVLIALAFLVALGAAQAHSYSHVVQDQAGAPNTTQSCDKCLSCAPLLAGAGDSQSVILLVRQDEQQIVRAANLPVSSVSRPSSFHSRAPPDLL
jgi:hypothetical protein